MRFRILAKDLCRASHALRSEQRRELVHRYFYCPNNCPHGATVKRRMHRNGYRIAALADQADVTTLLSHLPVAKFIERLNTIASGDGGHLIRENCGKSCDLIVQRSNYLGEIDSVSETRTTSYSAGNSQPSLDRKAHV